MATKPKTLEEKEEEAQAQRSARACKKYEWLLDDVADSYTAKEAVQIFIEHENLAEFYTENIYDGLEAICFLTGNYPRASIGAPMRNWRAQMRRCLQELRDDGFLAPFGRSSNTPQGFFCLAELNAGKEYRYLRGKPKPQARRRTPKWAEEGYASYESAWRDGYNLSPQLTKEKK